MHNYVSWHMCIQVQYYYYYKMNVCDQVNLILQEVWIIPYFHLCMVRLTCNCLTDYWTESREGYSLPESEAIKLNVELHVLSIVYLYQYVGTYTGNVNWTVLNALDHILVKAVI